jgi:hypothetical protein
MDQSSTVQFPYLDTWKVFVKCGQGGEGILSPLPHPVSFKIQELGCIYYTMLQSKEINTLMFSGKKYQIVWQVPMVWRNLMVESSGYNTQKKERRLHQNNHTYQSDYTVTSKNTVILEDLLHT